MSFSKYAGRLLLLAICASFMSGCIINIPLGEGMRAEKMEMEVLIPSQSAWETDKVLLIPIDGEISLAAPSSSMFPEASTVLYVMDVLKKAEQDHSIKAILLRVNSPGGSVTASDLLYHELSTFKKRTGVKVEALLMGLAASGGYYAAMSADHITALPTCVTGSIGVIGFFPTVDQLSKKIGFDMRVVKSGPYKDMGSLWRDFSPEERKIFQDMIDTFYEQFLSVVEAGRPNLDRERIRELGNGEIYTAADALKKGLIDRIGYVNDAFAHAMAISRLDDASLVVYKYPGDYKGNYYAVQETQEKQKSPNPEAASQVNLLNVDLGSRHHNIAEPFHYLWVP